MWIRSEAGELINAAYVERVAVVRHHGRHEVRAFKGRSYFVLSAHDDAREAVEVVECIGQAIRSEHLVINMDRPPNSCPNLRTR